MGMKNGYNESVFVQKSERRRDAKLSGLILLEGELDIAERTGENMEGKLENSCSWLLYNQKQTNVMIALNQKNQ